MRKENVFLVSGRYCSAEGFPRGDVINIVVCGIDDNRVRSLVKKESPDFSIVSLTNLVSLEERVRKVKAVLAGDDSTWAVLIDPELQVVR